MTDTTSDTTTTTADTTTTTTAPPAFEWAKAPGIAPENMAVIAERGWKTPGDLFNSYRNLESLTGLPPDRIVKLPGSNDPADAWNGVYERLGKPKEAAGYKIAVPEGQKDDFAKSMAPLLHKANLTQAQVDALVPAWNEHMTAQQKAAADAQKQAFEAGVAKLKSDWGDQYDARSAMVDRAATAFGMAKEQLDALKAAMGVHGAMTFLHNIGSKLGADDKFVTPGDKANTFGSLSPGEAQARVAELRKDKDFAQRYNSPDPEVRKRARDEMNQLQMIAFGQAA